MLLLFAGSIITFAPEARATQCFYGDFDDDDDPWTIRTVCVGDACVLDFILEATGDSPAGRDFTIIVREGCCDAGPDGYYGTRVEMIMNSVYVDAWTTTYTTCTCCSDWYIDGHFRNDAVFVPGQRYRIGTGTAEPLCDDTWWQCEPPHTFQAEYLVGHQAPCDGNTIEMSVQCPTSDAHASDALPAAYLGMPSPNPVTGDMRFAVRLAEAGPASVRVYDAAGGLVAILLDRELSAGSHIHAWRPVDARGARLASGIYFLRLDAPFGRASRPFVIAR
jgi:hypothetical protein